MRRSLLLAPALLLAAGCSDGDPEVKASAGDFASASADGDAATEAAYRKNAKYECPASASTAGRAATPQAGRLRVATTVAPITSIVANIAGDKADVVGIVPEGTNSHTFEPKPSVAETFTKADVVIINGLKLEEPTRLLAERNTKPSAQIVELGAIALPEDQFIYDFSFPRDGGKPNPHLWPNPPMARCYATAAASVLSKADPANASTYAANASAYTAKLDALDAAMRTAQATVPAGQRKLLTYHDAYAYFAAWYQWTVLGAIQVETFEEPTPKEVAALISQVKAEKVPAIFGSEVFPSPVLEQIGKEAGVRYVDSLRDDDLPGAPGDPDHSFLGLLKLNFTTIVTSLGGDPSALASFDTSDVAEDGASYPQ